MSDVAVSTPAAPAASGGSPAPSPASAPSGVPAAPAGGAPPRPRNTSGQFLPKDGAGEGAGEQPPGPGATEAQKEAYRLRRKLKVFGKEEEVDLDEDGIVRELQKKRALEKKFSDFEQARRRAERIIELAEKDPVGFLQELGKDPDALARQRVAEKARLEAMTEQERELHELRQWKKQQEEAAAKAKEQAEKQKKEALKADLVKKNNERFIKALEKSGLPKTYESLYFMAETARIALDDGIEYTDEELAKETARRLDNLTERYLGSLDGPALTKKLGPKRVQAILEAAVAEFDAQQDVGRSTPPAQESAPPATPEPEYIDEAEVQRRLRSIWNGR